MLDIIMYVYSIVCIILNSTVYLYILLYYTILYTYITVQKGYTPIIYACMYGHTAVVSLLLQDRALNVNFKDKVSKLLLIMIMHII